MSKYGLLMIMCSLSVNTLYKSGAFRIRNLFISYAYGVGSIDLWQEAGTDDAKVVQENKIYLIVALLFLYYFYMDITLHLLTIAIFYLILVGNEPLTKLLYLGIYFKVFQ